MYEKDHLLKSIQILSKAILVITNKIDSQENINYIKIKIDKTYSLLGKPSSFFQEETFEEIKLFLTSYDEQNPQKVELLASLIFLEGKVETSYKLKCNLFRKAKKIWEFYDEISKEYSFEREQNISYINSFLRQ